MNFAGSGGGVARARSSQMTLEPPYLAIRQLPDRLWNGERSCGQRKELAERHLV